MNIKLVGKVIGKPFQNKKKSGFLCKIAEVDTSGNILSTPMVFSQDLNTFVPDDKGFVSINCQTPDFFMVSR